VFAADGTVQEKDFFHLGPPAARLQGRAATNLLIAGTGKPDGAMHPGFAG
jgi:hypothetical protein